MDYTYSAPNNETGSKTYAYAFHALVAAGLAISIYLLYQYIFNGGGGKADVCSAVFGKGCSGALNSSTSNQFGLPLAAWGIIYYCVMYIILLAPAFVGKSYKINAWLFIFTLSILGVIGSISLLVTMIINPALFCPFCLIIHFINITLFFVIKKYRDYPVSNYFNELALTIRRLFTFRNRNLVLFKWLGLGSFILLISCFYFGLQILIASEKSAFAPPEETIRLFEEAPLQKIPINSDDPVVGNQTSPIQLIVFSDFECNSCAGFAMVVEKLKKKYKDKFYVVFKHFPLGNCNPSIQKEIHPKACEAALAAEAARQQGKFNAYHSYLFFFTDLAKSDESFAAIATRLNLDVAQFNRDKEGEVAKMRVAKNIREGIELKINGTPSVYLNGRTVNDFRLEPMEVLFEHLLKGDSISTKVNSK